MDGILGFGWGGDFLKSAAILNTLSSKARPEWHITQERDYVPMPRMFAFTASDAGAELQLGGFDPASILGTMHMAPMVGVTYSVNVSSIKYNGEELLSFSKEGPVIPPNPNRKAHDPSKPYRPGPYKAYSGLFDSGTTCNLIPDSTVFGVFTDSPYQARVAACDAAVFVPYTLGSQRYLAARGRASHLMPLEYTVGTRTSSAAREAGLFIFVFRSTAAHSCCPSATSTAWKALVRRCPLLRPLYGLVTFATDNALILGDPWFRQFVIFHDLRHHEVTDKTNNVRGGGGGGGLEGG